MGKNKLVWAKISTFTSAYFNSPPKLIPLLYFNFRALYFSYIRKRALYFALLTPQTLSYSTILLIALTPLLRLLTINHHYQSTVVAEVNGGNHHFKPSSFSRNG